MTVTTCDIKGNIYGVYRGVQCVGYDDKTMRYWLSTEDGIYETKDVQNCLTDHKHETFDLKMLMTRTMLTRLEVSISITA
jgi:uncharacterized protein (UPF0335 family)